MKLLRQWWEARKRNAELAEYDAGFDYVAGQLLRGINPVSVFGIFQRTAFDKGGQAAVDAWEDLQRVDDPSCPACGEDGGTKCGAVKCPY